MRIPIKAAEEISKKYNLAQVMIIGWQPEDATLTEPSPGTVQTATYGINKQHCRWVARLRDKFMEFLGVEIHPNAGQPHN